MSNKIEWEKYMPTEMYDNDDEIDEDEEDVLGLKTVISTPFGMYKVDNSLNPFKRFNFWLANTNFTISKRIKRILNEIHGVEALVFLSRYQFIIGIGKLFDEDEVKQTIEQTFCGQSGGEKKFADILNEMYPFWVLYKFPNDNTIYYGDRDKKHVLNKLAFYNELKQVSHGKIYSSESLLNE